MHLYAELQGGRQAQQSVVGVGERSERTAGGLTVAAEGSRLQVWNTF